MWTPVNLSGISVACISLAPGTSWSGVVTVGLVRAMWFTAEFQEDLSCSHIWQAQQPRKHLVLPVNIITFITTETEITREVYLKCEIISQEKNQKFSFFFYKNLEKLRVSPKFRLIQSITNTESHCIAPLKFFLRSSVTNKCSREKQKSKSHWLDKHLLLKRCYLQRISINWFA